MPRCRDVVSLLVDYLEGRLPEHVRADLEQHLADCPACLRDLNTYRSTLSLLASLGEEDLPEPLRLRLRAFLDRRANN